MVFICGHLAIFGSREVEAKSASKSEVQICQGSSFMDWAFPRGIALGEMPQPRHELGCYTNAVLTSGALQAQDQPAVTALQGVGKRTLTW